jgi:hypothetical protein
MLRLAQAKAIIGRRRLARVVACGWLAPAENSRPGKAGAVYFDEAAVFAATMRAAREGYIPRPWRPRRPRPRRPAVNISEIEIAEI